MKVLIEKVSDLNDLIMQGEKLKAIEKFYHDDIVVQRNDDKPLSGKDENIKRFLEDQKNIVEFKSAKPLKVTIGEKTTMVEWQLNYKHRMYGEKNFTQVAVHNWENGLIISEKVYCGN